jgi:FAD/FMN-containing dehydrogenase
MHPFITECKTLVGASHVLHEGDLSAYEQDWRKRVQGRALAVVRPGTTAEVAAVVKLCVKHGLAMVPQGGNTGLVVGGVPDDSGMQVVLSTTRLRSIRHIDAANLTMTADAGCVLQTLQEAARAQGLWFPLSLAAQGSCTIGGNLATNAGGTQVLRFGNARDLCLGLEVVTPQGEVWSSLSGLRKDNTGYDLRGLMVGSEGTLGIITAATLKLHALPAASMTAMASCQTMENTVALLGLAQQRLAMSLTGFEVMNDFSLQLVAKHMPQLKQPWSPSPWAVLLESSDSESAQHARDCFEALLGEALDRGMVQDASIAESIAQSQGLWHLRESIPLAQAAEGLNIKHDISVPISKMLDFCRDAQLALEAAVPGYRLVNFGHLGDGNLHFNVQAPANGDAAAFLSTHEKRINTIVYDIVTAHGGSISAEHGVGSLKRDELAQRKDAVALATMRTIKRALDPLGVMNPGRVLDR